MNNIYSDLNVCRDSRRASNSHRLTLAFILVSTIQVLQFASSAAIRDRPAADPAFRIGEFPSATLSFAQQAIDIQVSGKITDVKGLALINASIGLKSGKTVGVSDLNGHFNVSVPADAILVVSYIGYQTQEIAVAGRITLNIVLKEREGTLAEVVVVGYTTQRKKDLTGAVSLVNSRDINGLPVGGVDQILQGKAAGVAVTQNTGAPGDGINIRIRGVGTINNNNPLYIVDGVPTTDGINEISPSDIESINILKDASSAAIYGARASNGVVIVTTKKGQSGKTRVSVGVYTGVQSAENLIPMANNAQYVNAYNSAAKNDSRAQISSTIAGTLSDVNWLKQVLKPAPVTNASLSISGGNDNSQYIVAANLFTQNGLIKNSSFNRFNIRTSLTSAPSRYFKIGTNMNLSYSKTRAVGTSGDGYSGAAASIVRYALFRTPGTPVYNSKGQFVDLPQQDPVLGNFLGDGINPAALADAANNNTYRYSVLGDAYLEIDPVKGLKIKSDLGGNLILSNNKTFFKTFGIDRSFNSPSSLSQNQFNELNYNWTNTATYDLTLGKHALNFLAGTELIKQDLQAQSESRNGFVNQTPNFQYLDNGTSASQQNGGNENHFALSSLFGSVHYQYNNKYLASVSYRRDGSSQLDPSARYQGFTSGSLGWRIDQEDFMKNARPISTLKLRASVGQLGNEQSIGNYPYVSLLGGGFYYPFGGISTQGYSITSKGNPNVRWESSTQQDAGLDIGFFDNALLLSADYYLKKTSRMLLFLPLPSSAGNGGNPAVNAGNVTNNGLELELTYRKQLNTDWNIGITGNFATVHNNVTALANGTPIAGGRIDNNYNATLTAVGHPIGSFFLLKQEGIFQNAQQVFTHALQGPGIRPGDVMYKDVNGDGVIDDKDRTFVGSPIPKITYGLTANVGYKNFDLSMFFQGVYGNKLYNQVNTDIEGFYRPFNITERVATQSWSGPGTSNQFPLLSWSDGNNNKMPSTRFLENGSYLKLKNVQLGYRLGKNALTSIGLANVRFYVSAQNVFTITKYTGLDPEQYNNSNNGNTVTAVGIDWGTYPSARTLTAGVNANF